MKKKGGMTTDSPDRLNVIVEGTRITGDIVAESNVRINGEIDGNVTSTSKVVIGITGRVKGNLICQDADIEGKVEGHLKIDNLLSLRSKADITGEILTSKIQIEEGAQFSGSCKMSNFSTSSSGAKSVSREENVVY